MSSISANSSSVISADIAFERGEKQYFSPEKEAELRAYSDQVLTGHIKANRDHLLVLVGKRFDFSELAAACRQYRNETETRGVEPHYSLDQLVKATVLKRIYGWSYRKTAQQIKTDMLARWFTGFTLHEEAPGFVTLQRFEQWVMGNQPRSYFTVVLRQILQDHPQEVKAIQIGDTFAMQTRAADVSKTQLLRDVTLQVWRHVEAVAWNEGPLEELEIRKGTVLGDEDEFPTFLLTREERDTRTFITAQAACTFLDAATAVVATVAKPVRPHIDLFHQWAERLQKVLADDFVFENDENGGHSVRFCKKEEKGSYRIISAVDPDATIRNHGKSVVRGYNISVAATTNFIHEIQAATGATPDSVGVSLLIAAQLEHLGMVPAKLIYDRAAGTPKIFHDVAKASGDQTQLVAHMVNYRKNKDRYGPDDFSLREGGVLTCPNGQSTSRAYRSGSGEGWNYRFMPDQCAGCPLVGDCREKKSKPGSYRQVFISDYIVDQRTAIAYTKTPEFKVEMKLRPHIERIIAGVVRYNGARHAEGYGLAQADYQARMAGMAYNLKRWAALQRQEKRGQQVRTGQPQVNSPPDTG